MASRIARETQKSPSALSRAFVILLGVGGGAFIAWGGLSALYSGTLTLNYSNGYGQVIHSETFVGAKVLPYSLAMINLGLGFGLAAVLGLRKAEALNGARPMSAWQNRLLVYSVAAIFICGPFLLLPRLTHNLNGGASQQLGPHRVAD